MFSDVLADRIQKVGKKPIWICICTKDNLIYSGYVKRQGLLTDNKKAIYIKDVLLLNSEAVSQERATLSAGVIYASKFTMTVCSRPALTVEKLQTSDQPPVPDEFAAFTLQKYRVLYERLFN